jgi:hypothetical protein
LNYIFDLIALGASFFALYFIIRAKKTFFLDSRFFIGIATFGFILYLIEATVSDSLGQPVSVFLDTLLIAIMGTSIGVASYLLKSNDQRTSTGGSELKRFISKPPLPFLVFLSIVFAWTFVSLIFQPWTLNQSNVGGIIYYYTYPAWYILTSAVLLTSFLGLPVVSFYRESLSVRDKTASLSMKIISFCWAMFPIFLFFPIAAGGFLLPTSQNIGFLVDSLLFILISFALRESTVLARIVTAGEAISQVVSSHLETDTIVLYNTESDRKKLIETVVKDGLSAGQGIVCRVTKSEVPFYRAVLKSADLLDAAAGKNNVTIQSLETTPRDTVDIMTPDKLLIDRELVDLDELGLERSKEIIDNITALDGRVKNRRTGRIWALNIDGAQAGILDLLSARNPTARVIDLARQRDLFANLLALKHQDILGSRMLLEYEPTSNYEEIIQKFAREFQANVESVAIFTHAGSPVYREFIDQRNVRLFSFSTKTSTPSRISDEQILLPERDTSLLLDAVDKLLEAHTGRRIGIVFEVFTYLILSLGFEKTYGVISSIVEMAESELATILLVVNSDALEPRTLSGIRGLFQSQLSYDSNGLRAVRLAGEENRKAGTTESLSEEHEVPRRIEV